MPLTIRSTSPTPLQVRVLVTSPKLDFPDGAAQIVTLDTANTTVTFKVKARASGTFPLDVKVTSPDGTLPIANRTSHRALHRGLGSRVRALDRRRALPRGLVDPPPPQRTPPQSPQDATAPSLFSRARGLSATARYSPPITTVADDRELVTAAQAGDRAAMEALLRRHYDRINALCRRITGSEADGADATQEALIAVVKGLPRFDGRAQFSTWAYRVATNVCLDELRRQRRRPVTSFGDGDHAAAADPMDDVPLLDDRVGDRLDIDAALAKLPAGLPRRRRAARRVSARLRRDRPGAGHPARHRAIPHRPGARCGRGDARRVAEPRSPAATS